MTNIKNMRVKNLRNYEPGRRRGGCGRRGGRARVILYEKSKRFISIEDAIGIVEQLPPFVQDGRGDGNANERVHEPGLEEAAQEFGIAQLHGEESPGHVKAVGQISSRDQSFSGGQSAVD